MRKRKKIFFTNIFKNVYFFNFLCQIAFFRRLRPLRPPGGPSDGARPGLARLRPRGGAGDGQPRPRLEDVRGGQGQGRLPGICIAKNFLLVKKRKNQLLAVLHVAHGFYGLPIYVFYIIFFLHKLATSTVRTPNPQN